MPAEARDSYGDTADSVAFDSYRPEADDFSDCYEFSERITRVPYSCGVAFVAFLVMVITLAVLGILAARGWHW